MSLFSKEEINAGRQNFLDIAKALSILFMINIHCLEHCGLIDEEAGVSIDSLGLKIATNITGGVFAAPVFMFCMGIGLEYSRHKEPDCIFERGAKFLPKAYLLNLMRGFLPLLILCIAGVYELNEKKGSMLFEIFNLDILHFVAVALMLFALLLKLNISRIGIFSISVVMGIIGSFVRKVNLGAYWKNVLAGFLIGTKCDDYIDAFPLCNWFAFVAGGYLFAHYLKHSVSVGKFLRFLCSVSVVIFAFYIRFAFCKELYMFDVEIINFYHMNVFDMFFCFSGVFLMLGFSYMLSKTLPKPIMQLACRTSKNINGIYCIQWLIIEWGKFVLLLQNIKLDFISAIILSLVLFVVSAWLAGKYATLHHSRQLFTET